MSITFMENFTFDGARNADGSSVVPNLNDAKNIMKRRGGDFYNGGQTLWNSATFATETDGRTRPPFFFEDERVLLHG